MSDLFWGQSSTSWTAIGSLGQWVGAFGTIAAVATALCLAKRDSDPKISLLVFPDSDDQKKTTSQNTTIIFRILNGGKNVSRILDLGVESPVDGTRHSVLGLILSNHKTTVQPNNHTDIPIDFTTLVFFLLNHNFKGKHVVNFFVTDGLQRSYFTSIFIDLSYYQDLDSPKEQIASTT